MFASCLYTDTLQRGYAMVGSLWLRSTVGAQTLVLKAFAQLNERVELVFRPIMVKALRAAEHSTNTLQTLSRFTLLAIRKEALQSVVRRQVCRSRFPVAMKPG
jgi:hypothetical protein